MGRFDPPKPPPDPALARIEQAIATLAEQMQALGHSTYELPVPQVSVSPTPVNVSVPTEGITDAVTRAIAEALAALPEPETPQIALDRVTADVDLMPLVEAAQDQRAVLEALQEKLSNLTGGTRSHFDGRLRFNGRLVANDNPLATNSPIDYEPGIGAALAQLESNTGKQFTVSGKNKTLLKFGKRTVDLANTRVTVWQSPADNETYQTDNTIDSMVSTDAADTETMTIEGHTIDGSGDFTFVVQTATLTGQTPVTLGTPLARVSRAYNSSSTDLVGDVTIYRSSGATVTAGAVSPDENIHLDIDSTAASDRQNQSFKAATTLSSVDALIVTQVNVEVRKAQTAAVDFRFEVREPGGVFRPRLIIAAASTGSTATDVPLNPHIVIPPNSDVRITANSTNNNTEVGAFFNGYLAIDKAAL